MKLFDLLNRRNLVTKTMLCVFFFIGLQSQNTAMAFKKTAFSSGQLLRVKVYNLIVDPETRQPLVILSDEREKRGMPIWIGFFEANAINSEMQGIEHPRPLTHDLLASVIQKARLKIHRIIITHLKENTYYATIFMGISGSLVEIDARPSDSIATALKFNAPIFVSQSLFNKAAFPLSEQGGGYEEYGLTFQDLTPALAKAFEFGSTRGILVSHVRKGSQAEKDGLERGDIVYEMEGAPVENATSMREALEKDDLPLEVKIFRRGQPLSLVIRPK